MRIFDALPAAHSFSPLAFMVTKISHASCIKVDHTLGIVHRAILNEVTR